MSRFAKLSCVAMAAVAALTTSAGAAVPHTVLPGETLWSIAAANNYTTDTVATFNGVSADSQVYTGQTIQIPTEDEGATALATAGTATAAASNSTGGAPGSTATEPSAEHPSWTSPIYCPPCASGEAYLASNAAANWNAMRQASLSAYGIDLYPAGPYSAYRSYGQQLYLYGLYLSGEGSLAAAPGTSSHEYGYALDLADASMRTVVDQIGATYGWAKTEAPEEWWHVSYVGP